MIITVSQLNNYIKAMLDSDAILLHLSVKGEVSNLQRVRDNVYFALKDDISQIDCFCYSKNDMDDIDEGANVIIEGRPNFYSKLGKFSLTVSKVKKVDDVGDIYKQFLLLKEQLTKEGCFDKPKRQLVKHPRRIGVVTSATGAVIHDIITVASRRNPSVDIVLFPVKVQGLGAVEEIVRGVDFFSTYAVDTIIVARGGGSLEDMSAFNSKEVVYALNRCSKPTISAVGHETDFSLADFAADVRAATPSVAAELAMVDVKLIKLQIAKWLDIIDRRTQAKYIELHAQCVYNLKELQLAIDNKLSQIDAKIKNSIFLLDAFSPSKRLKQGYAYLSSDGKKFVVKDAQIGQSVVAYVEDGIATLKVESLKNNIEGE